MRSAHAATARSLALASGTRFATGNIMATKQGKARTVPKGSALLKKWADKRRKTSSMVALAAELGISRVYLFRLCAGTDTPSLDLAIRIEVVAGVPCAAWETV